MISRLLSLSKTFLHASLLVILLCLYGCTRAFSHISYRSKRSSASASDFEQDLKRWKKVPKHLALNFVPSTRAMSRQDRLLQIAEDAAACLEWSARCGVERISFYDAEGLIKRNAHSFKSLLLSLSSVTISDLSSRPTFKLKIKGQEMTIYLVAQEDGKASIADTTTIFSEAVQNKMLQLQDIDVPLLNEKLESIQRSPELMIVAGGRQLKLHGFPPWHIRLTEIYHEPSLGLLGPSRLTYGTFKRAMDLYSGCEMRFGR